MTTCVMSECERKERFDGQTIIPPLWSKYTHQRCRKEQLDCSLIVGQGQIVRRVAWKTRRDQINLPVGPSSEPQQERVRVEVGGRTRRRWKTEGRRWTGEVGIDSNYRASWEALIAYGHFRLFFFTFFSLRLLLLFGVLVARQVTYHSVGRDVSPG